MYQTLVEMLLHMLALVSGRNGCPSLNSGTTRQSTLLSAAPLRSLVWISTKALGSGYLLSCASA